jgi:hypothetical protein
VTVEEKKNPPDCKSLGRTLQFLIKPTQMCTCFVYRSFYRFLLNKLQVRSFSLSIGTDVNCVASTDCAIARSMYLIISDAFSNHQQSSRLKWSAQEDVCQNCTTKDEKHRLETDVHLCLVGVWPMISNMLLLATFLRSDSMSFNLTRILTLAWSFSSQATSHCAYVKDFGTSMMTSEAWDWFKDQSRVDLPGFLNREDLERINNGIGGLQLKTEEFKE